MSDAKPEQPTAGRPADEHKAPEETATAILRQKKCTQPLPLFGTALIR